MPKFVSTATDLKDDVIIIGTIGSSEILNKLVAAKKLRTDSVQKQWECFLTKAIDNPLPNNCTKSFNK